MEKMDEKGLETGFLKRNALCITLITKTSYISLNWRSGG